MATEFKGKVELDIRDSEPDWGPYAAPTAPEDAPNILYLVWDDTGIATWDCFGGLVEMKHGRPLIRVLSERRAGGGQGRSEEHQRCPDPYSARPPP